MPKYTYGSIVKKRVKRLLEALLDFANWEFEDSKFDIKFKWEAENSANPKLIIETTQVALGYLTEKDKYPSKLSKTQIQEALNLLKDFLKILEDNRTQTQGVDIWHFTLKLWSKDKKKNLEQFEQAWEANRREKSKALQPTQKSDESYWQEICRTMLEKHKRLTTNQLLFADEEMKFELKEIHVPLALVQRTKPKKCSEDIPAEQGSRLYEPSYEEKQRFEHEAFLGQIIRDGVGKTQGHRIALIGEPGAGKTTQLQTIAFWILNNNLGLPIWISLADLQGKSVENYLLQDWLKNALKVVDVTKEQKETLGKLFKNNCVWLLLDAADEMSSLQPLTEISNQLTGWVEDARVVLTCRVNVWEANANALENFETYRLLNFEYPQQVQEFIGGWFHNKDADKGERLWNELDKAEHQRIQDLVKNPLRLALLCSTWQSSDKGLPKTKAGLYHLFVKRFYTWKKNRFRTTQQQRETLNAALGDLAKRAIDQETSRFRLRHEFVSNELGDPEQEDSLFWLALKLGWLNQVGLAAESDEEEVYAFFHPTFEEYFAALAVDDWHEFLNHVPDNPALGIYRIFAPQWKEVILLWLGREDVRKDEKDAFLDALVGFDDSCGDFYRFKSYFLAAICLAEYEHYKGTEEIFTQLIYWGFGDLNRMGEILETPITTNAKAALFETNRRNLTTFLTNILRASQDEVRLLKLAKIAVQIKTDNEEEVEQVLNNLQSSKDLSIRFYASCVLEKLRKKHSISIETIEINEPKEKFYVLDENNKIVGHLTVAEYFNQLRQFARFIDLNSDDNSLLMENLNKLLNLGRNNFNRSLIAHAMGEICGENFNIYNALMKIMYASKEGNVLQSASFCLIDILQSQIYPLAVNNLKECINQKEEDSFQFVRRIYCFEVIWHCAQSMPYPVFYQAWHQQEKVKDGE
jgi:hypothetical protein